MPRAARIKEPTAIYHAMSRSITEFDLFKEDADKDSFLDLLKKYKEKFQCKVYGYCLMTNHYHLIVDTCGYDISKFMKCLNQSYVKYINRKYGRRGHLLAERFYSKVIDSQEYLLTVSAYVHNNPKEIPEYTGREVEYPYSSMGIYTGKHKDRRSIIDTDFILRSITENGRRKATKAYVEMVSERRDLGVKIKLREYLDEFLKEQFVYKSHRQMFLRDKKPEDVIRVVADIFKVSYSGEIMRKWKRKTMEFRQAVAYILAVYCGMNIREICKHMMNISASCCAKLCDKGFELFCRNNELKIAMGV